MTNYSKSNTGLYFVIADDGKRFGPVSRDILLIWQDEGRILPDMLLEAEGQSQSFLVSDVLPAIRYGSPLPAIVWEGSAEVLIPEDDFAPDWVAEFRVRTKLTPQEAANGCTREIRISSTKRIVRIPPLLVSRENPRVKYRLQGQGIRRESGEITDLVLLLEYVEERAVNDALILIATPVAFEKGISTTTSVPAVSAPAISVPALPPSGGMPSAEQRSVLSQAETVQPSPPTEKPPVAPRPAVPMGDTLSPPPTNTKPVREGVTETVVRVTISREKATQGGSLAVLLPDSGEERLIHLPPGLERLGQSHRLAFPNKGARNADGSFTNLKVLLTIVG
jgi:hypothetical protein